MVTVGPGPERERLLRRVTDEGIANVTLLPPIPKASIPEFLARIDIAFIGLLPQPLFRFGISPNKLMDYMMAAKPIVMAIDSGNDPVGDSGCGVTVAPGDPVAIRSGILHLAAMQPEQLQEMGARGRRYVIAEHSYKVLAQKFLRAIEY